MIQSAQLFGHYQDAGHARFNISTKNKTESAQEFGRYLMSM